MKDPQPAARRVRIASAALAVLLVLALYALGVWLRVRHIDVLAHRQSLFPDGDGWHWARLADLLRHGPLPSRDPLRNVPELVANPWPPPLVSLLPAGLESFGFAPRTLYLWLPPLLSMLFVVPLWFYLRRFAPLSVYVGAALAGSLGPPLLARSMPGCFDSDVLILLFGFLVAALVTRVAEERRPWPAHLLAAGSGLALRLFQWWYPKPLFVLLFIGALVASLLVARQGWRRTATLTAVAVLFAGPLALLESLGGSRYLFDRVLGNPAGGSIALPVSLASTIGELRPPVGAQWYLATTGALPALILAVIGLAALLIRRFRPMVASLPLLAAGLATVGAGSKNLLYLMPFLGMGLGFAAHGLALLPTGRKKLIAAASCLVAAGLAQSPARWRELLAAESPPPFVDDRTMGFLQRLRTLTEPNAVLWSWWDLGYPLEALAQRATVSDGETLVPAKIDLLALSLFVDNEQTARNVIAYATTVPSDDYPAAGLGAIRAAARRFGGPLPRPVYVVLTHRMFVTGYLEQEGLAAAGDPDWSWQSLRPRVDIPCRVSPSGSYDCAGVGPNGFAALGGTDWRELTMVDRAAGTRELLKRRGVDGRADIAQIEILRDGETHLVVTGARLARSMLGRLWLQTGALQHFQLVLDGYPDVVVWRVR